ncbi:MAG: hypothetical protein KM312_12125 [Hydrogenibacillus schlegelii]|uniref:Uncharacterized protein n=1 Tax=Hydrogenibacillus schlegelii TaxID=1484 RepID=A0A947CZK9_HYDSH|nr:hypothetical protein [Hydrogenibacillus schlegelii]
MDAADVKKDYSTLIAALLILLLFLAQDKPDLSETSLQPEPRQIKRSGRTLEPVEPKVILAGRRWGSAIRRVHVVRTVGASGEVDSGSCRRSVTSHIRRAHWHLYWTG